jgi:hypothetical protein
LFLKLAKRKFHHRPKTNMTHWNTINCVFYWYPDLESEALAHGWQPRGKMTDSVAWTRKDLPEINRGTVTPALESTKQHGNVTFSDEKKPSAKRRLF